MADGTASRRLNVDLEPDLYEELRQATVADGVSISDRVRGLLEMWRADPALQVQSAQRGSQLAAATRRRRLGP